MKDYLISLYIDNELDLDEKIEFVETVHGNARFKDETIELLDQEKTLRADLNVSMPEVHVPVVKKSPASGWLSAFLPPLAGFVTAMRVASVFFLQRPEQPLQVREPYRFVLYNPDAGRTEIVGSFTDWTPVEMEKIGSSGYWALTLRLSPGEHRYSYLVGNGQRIADPTVPVREQDDFGGENSIIEVTAAI